MRFVQGMSVVALALLTSKTNSGCLYQSWLTLSSAPSAQIEGAGCELGVQQVFRQQAVLLRPARIRLRRAKGLLSRLARVFGTHTIQINATLPAGVCSDQSLPVHVQVSD